MKTSFLSVEKPASAEIVIEKSRFICSCSPVDGEEDAKAFLQSVKSKYTDASSICYAYVADEYGFCIKFSDGGEPQGTAGMPMLEVLKNRKLYKVAVVVTRYFGGIKLGAGGLVRAFSESACSGLEEAGIVEYVQSSIIKIKTSFKIYPKILKYFSSILIKVLDTEFINDGVNISFAVPVADTNGIKAKIMDISAGKAEFEVIKERYEVYKK